MGSREQRGLGFSTESDYGGVVCRRTHGVGLGWHDNEGSNRRGRLVVAKGRMNAGGRDLDHGHGHDHGCGRGNGDVCGKKALVWRNGDDGLWRRNRGGARVETLVERRASVLARFEPDLLSHHDPDRLSWQPKHVEADVNA